MTKVASRRSSPSRMADASTNCIKARQNAPHGFGSGWVILPTGLPERRRKRTRHQLAPAVPMQETVDCAVAGCVHRFS